jgi:hypothetical protein
MQSPAEQARSSLQPKIQFVSLPVPESTVDPPQLAMAQRKRHSAIPP